MYVLNSKKSILIYYRTPTTKFAFQKKSQKKHKLSNPEGHRHPMNRCLPQKATPEVHAKRPEHDHRGRAEPVEIPGTRLGVHSRYSISDAAATVEDHAGIFLVTLTKDNFLI